MRNPLGCTTLCIGGNIATLEETAREIGEMLRSMDGPLPDQVRVEMGVQHIVEYFRAAQLQQSRINEWLYEPERRSVVSTRFPLDQGAALCEAHFLFICWDTIFKSIENLRQNSYA